MFERIVALKAEEAYSELKNQLFKQNSKLVTDEPTKHLVVEQGSLFGMTPKGIKKRIEFYLHPQGNSTRVVAKSSLASDWVKLNAISYVVGSIFLMIPLLLAFNIESSVTAQQNSFWGFFTQALDITNNARAIMLANVLKGAAMFIGAVIVVSIVADVFAYKRKYALIEETLTALP